MDLTLSDKETGFFKQIWKILGRENITKGDLIYEICYKLNLPFRPSLVNKKVKEAEEKGILVRNGEKLSLPEEIQEEIKNEKEKFFQNHGKLFPSQVVWDRMEGSSDPWIMKPNSNDYTSLVKNALYQDEISRGQKVKSEQVELLEADSDSKIVEAVIQGSGNKKYSLKIDVIRKEIHHDCEDFIHHRIKNRELCKHFYRIIYNLKTVNPEVGNEFLNEFSQSRESWKFIGLI
jgi:hypothetical protein